MHVKTLPHWVSAMFDDLITLKNLAPKTKKLIPKLGLINDRYSMILISLLLAWLQYLQQKPKPDQ